jgi:hypothetical protein
MTVRPITAKDLGDIVRVLPARTSFTGRKFPAPWRRIWIAWIAEYGGPGFYGRRTPGRWARLLYVRLQSVPMLSWLSEQLGVPPSRLARAVSQAADLKPAARAAASFRRAVPWREVELLLRGRLNGASVGTPAELRRRIGRLSEASPETDRFSAAWDRRPDGAHERKPVWYSSQKEHWLGWLRYYDGPGAYGRQVHRGRSAAFVYNQVVNPQMLIWLAEAVGVERQVVRRAAALALRRHTMSAMSGAIRQAIPWEEIHPRLA